MALWELEIEKPKARAYESKFHGVAMAIGRPQQTDRIPSAYSKRRIRDGCNTCCPSSTAA